MQKTSIKEKRMVNQFKRVSQVVKSAYSSGLGHYLKSCGLKVYVPLPKIGVKKSKNIQTGVRKSLEELGGAYVKLGQLLSLRPDLVPPEFANEFRKLQDEVPACSAEEAISSVEKELGKNINEVFSHFDPKPLGSASIAQAHFARLRNGKTVVVKIKRPGIDQIFNADIATMKYVAQKLSQRYPYANLKEIVSEFNRYTKKELNLLNEQRNIKKFYEALKGDRKVKVPQVYDEYCTKKILVMEYLPGEKLSKIKLSQAKKKIIAKNLIDTSLKQIFETDIFHADLHPGNILVGEENRIGMLDYGIVGSLDSKLRKRTTEMYIAIIEKDIDAIVKTLIRTGIVTKEFREEEFRYDVKEVVDEWWGSSLKDAKITHLMRVLFSTSTRHGLKIPADLFLLAKALVTTEGTALTLNPDFRFVEYSKPYINDLLKRQFKKKLSYKEILKRVKKAEVFTEEMVEHTKDIVDKLKEGIIEININDTDIKHLGHDMNKSSNRLSYSLIIAAFVIAAAMLVDFGPSYLGYPIFTSVAILAAIIMAVPLIGSILREGHPKYDPHMEEY